MESGQICKKIRRVKLLIVDTGGGYMGAHHNFYQLFCKPVCFMLQFP